MSKETFERMLERCRWIGLIDSYKIDEQKKTQIVYKGASYNFETEEVKEFLRMIVRGSTRQGLLHDLDEM